MQLEGGNKTAAKAEAEVALSVGMNAINTDTDDYCEDTTTTAALLKQKLSRRPFRKNGD